MKNIDIKSIIIGALLTSTIFLGVAATSPTDKWDKKQMWEVQPADRIDIQIKSFDPVGWEPIAVQGESIIYRKRTN